MAIVVSRVVDRLHVCLPDGGDVAQRNRPLGSGNRNENVSDLLYGLEPAQGLYDKFHIVDAHLAAGQENVLLPQTFADVGGLDTQLRNLGV